MHLAVSPDKRLAHNGAMALTTAEQPWQRLYLAAEQAIAREHWLAAEPLLRQTLALVPEHASAWHLLGKVFAEQDELDAALDAQQSSCRHDPALGWNWFAAGELLMELERYDEAAQAFDQAIAALPAEGWIRHQGQEARLAARLGGERLSEGLGPRTYRYWIAHHEPRLPSEAAVLAQPFWLLEPDGSGQGRWRALHSDAPLPHEHA